MKKAGVIKKLVAAGIEHDPKATMAELEKLLPAGGDPPKKDEGSDAPPETSGAKEISKKISGDELISLQKEGRLKGYDPKTGIGIVLSKGNKINWPEVSADKK